MKKLDIFCSRLKAIGVDVELIGNYPWVYLKAVNGVPVKERYWGNHGFTILFRSDPSKKLTDRRRVFKKIREMLNGDEVFEEDDYDRHGC